MAAPTAERKTSGTAPPSGITPAPKPYVPDSANLHEFTWPAVLAGIFLGILFGASSLYLVLKVGMTVSASIPVAVLSITLFRVAAKLFGLRPATILENNIVQTTGSAGESIAFGIGVTMPALMLLGFEMSVIRVMTVGVLGGLLGVLLMIPLRRAFIIQQHDTLPYPEGTACAEVLIVGEEGGSTAHTVFAGFGLALLYKGLMKVANLWNETVSFPTSFVNSAGKMRGLKGGEFGIEVSPELLGVGYIIGPRIASIMCAGGVLAYLVLIPMISVFGEQLTTRLPPAPINAKPIRAMTPDEIHQAYVLYIGAGAVATGGIISMVQSFPLIVGSLVSAFRDMSKSKRGAGATGVERTQRDLPLSVVVLGSLLLVVALAATPSLGLGLSWLGLAGALCILGFGFLFVTVSSRLTGQIGSSSNPISGMTVAALLLTCLAFAAMGQTDTPAKLTAAKLAAITVAGVICVAISNGGTTSQDLKTGYLVGATPRWQQLAILIGALTSALVIGGTLLLLDEAGTIYTKKHDFPANTRVDVTKLTKKEQVGGQYAETDKNMYHVMLLAANDPKAKGASPGKYLVDDQGWPRYYADPAINGRLTVTDDGKPVENKLRAPKAHLMALIIEGILGGELPWDLVLIGAMISVVLELAGVSSLPFAVGVYLPIAASTPIFVGGLLRWGIDKFRRQPSADADTSPGVLFSTGYIAGGSIAGILIALLSIAPQALRGYFDFRGWLGSGWVDSPWPAIVAFTGLSAALLVAGLGLLSRGEPEQRKPSGKSAAKEP